MGTNSKAIYFASALEDARATLQTIVTVAQGYGNCLTDGVYRTDDVARCVIVGSLCRAYFYYIDCATNHKDAGAAVSERAAILAKVINDNIGALPEAIKECLGEVRDGDIDIDDDEADDEIDSAVYAADDAVKIGRDDDYTYKARLATAAMNVYTGLCSPADLDPDAIYIGLRLAAIKLDSVMGDATDNLGVAACSQNGSAAKWDDIDPAVSFPAMVAETQKAQALLYGFTGVDYRNADPARYEGDLEITQVINIVNKAAAAVKDKDVDAQITELCVCLGDLSIQHPEKAEGNAYRALSVVRKLAVLCNAMKE